MILMKTLNREERTLITISCEPFYLGFKETKQFINVHSELMKILPPNHKKDLWVIITACSQALRHNMDGSVFSLRKENYTTANKKNASKMSYVKCKRIVEELDKVGYITLYKGFYDHSNDLSVKSCFIINNKLRSMFDKVDFKRFGNPRPVETLIEIRDSETDQLITSLSKLRGIKSERELVKRYNDFLLPFDIRCKGKRACAVYKRVYTDSLEKHGRWYSQSSLQTTKSYLREFITIDGYKTTEIDYRQQHPRILMQLSGVVKPMSWTPYADIRDITKGESSASRKLCKVAMMCIINAKDLFKAKSALWKTYADDLIIKDRVFKGCILVKGSINLIFDRLLDRNKEIKHWFGIPDLWAVLQHHDSKITASILVKFMELGKCCLPWHDSFVVEVKDRDLLIAAMRSSWLEVLGSNSNCFYDIEF